MAASSLQPARCCRVFHLPMLTVHVPFEDAGEQDGAPSSDPGGPAVAPDAALLGTGNLTGSAAKGGNVSKHDNASSGVLRAVTNHSKTAANASKMMVNDSKATDSNPSSRNTVNGSKTTNASKMAACLVSRVPVGREPCLWP